MKSFEMFLHVYEVLRGVDIWGFAHMSQTMQPANPNTAEIFQYQTPQRSTNEPWRELYLERRDIKQWIIIVEH